MREGVLNRVVPPVFRSLCPGFGGWAGMGNGGFFDGRIRTGAGRYAVKERNRYSNCEGY
ncbi:hypothetical protein [Eisenbergiella sp.]